MDTKKACVTMRSDYMFNQIVTMETPLDSLILCTIERGNMMVQRE